MAGVYEPKIANCCVPNLGNSPAITCDLRLALGNFESHISSSRINQRFLNMSIRSFLVTLALTFFLVANTWAASGIEELQRFLNEVDGLEARFEQTLLNIQDRQTTSTRGIFYLKRPDKFRWDYLEPDSQQLIADGRQIWLYDPELEQVSVQSQKKALKGTPAMLLVSGDRLSDTFEITDMGSREDLSWVQLIPKDEESQFIRVLLAFADGELRRMEMADKFGQITRFSFHDIRKNPEFDSNFFRFERPFGTDIYNR